jgi:hypothetical protein
MRWPLFICLMVTTFATIILARMPANASVTVSGSVSRIISSTEFSFYTGYPYDHVPVFYSQSMVTPTGSVIRVGENVTVVGAFNRSGQLLATSVQVGSTAGPYHIDTWALDGAGNAHVTEGLNASAASVNLLVTYALGGGKARSDCSSGTRSCKSAFYLDYAMAVDPYPSSCNDYPNNLVVEAATESWFLHDTGYTDSSHRVYGKDASGTCTIFAMNPNSPGLQAWWRAFLQANATGFNAIYFDSNSMDVPDAGWFPTGGGCDPWPHVCTSMEEIANNSAEVAARVNFANAMYYSNGSPMYGFYQQADLNNPALDLAALAASSSFLGVTCEGCIASPGRVNPGNYSRVLNEMAAVAESPRGSFVLISNGSYPTGSANQIFQRLVTTGIVWVAYEEGRTMVQPNLEYSTDNLAIWPEDLIYPSNPLETMVTGALNLEVVPGVYRREFARCYQQGVLFGQCAAVVNATGSGVYIQASWFRQTYGHVITLSGGDVLSGGVANRAGMNYVPGVTVLPAGGALLLAP